MSSQVSLLPVLYKKGSLSAVADNANQEYTDQEPIIRIQEITPAKNEFFVEKDILVSIPTVSREELTHFSLSLDEGSSALLTMFESYILKDGRLALELVYVEGDYCLLFYSPKMHAYFHSGCKRSAVNQIVSMLLSYASVEKYCYSPYVLSSVARQMHMRIKNVWSIYSMSAILFQSHRMTMEAVFQEMGAEKAEGRVTIPTKGDMRSIALS